MDNLKFKQPRESRLIAGVVLIIFGIGLSFFTTLVALESFSENPIPITLFLVAGVSMIVVGLYFSACIPVMEFDSNNRTIVSKKSCIIFSTGNVTSFDKVKEIGIKELYRAGDHTEESGTSYYIEIRCDSNLEVPGSKSGHLNSSAIIAKEISTYVGVKFNPKIRKVFTGSFKVR